MRSGIVTVLVLIIIGTMLANILAHPEGTKTVLDGWISFWKTSMNGLLGKTS